MNELDIATLDIGHIDEKFPEKSVGAFLGQISWFVTFKLDMSAMRLRRHLKVFLFSFAE